MRQVCCLATGNDLSVQSKPIRELKSSSPAWSNIDPLAPAVARAAKSKTHKHSSVVLEDTCVLVHVGEVTKQQWWRDRTFDADGLGSAQGCFLLKGSVKTVQ